MWEAVRGKVSSELRVLFLLNGRYLIKFEPWTSPHFQCCRWTEWMAGVYLNIYIPQNFNLIRDFHPVAKVWFYLHTYAHSIQIICWSIRRHYRFFFENRSRRPLSGRSEMKRNIIKKCAPTVFYILFCVVLFSLFFRFPPLKRKWKNFSEKEKQTLGSENPLSR